MAFEIITGTCTRANDLIAAMVANWDFDGHGTTSEHYTCTWGSVAIWEDSGYTTKFTVRKGTTQILESVTIGSATSTYTIYKATNAMLVVIKYNGSTTSSDSRALLFTTTTSLADPTLVEKIVMTVDYNSGNPVYPKFGSTSAANTSSPTMSSPIYETSAESVQVYPFVQGNGGYKADNAYIVTRSTSPAFAGQVTFGGETYAVCYGIAIKDE
jgi:hypothetical protein